MQLRPDPLGRLLRGVIMCIIPGSEKDLTAHRDIDALTAAMAVHGRTCHALLQRGVAHKQLGHLGAAIEDLTAVTSMGGLDRHDTGKAHHFLAVCRRRTGDLDGALDAAEVALACDSSTPSTWVHRGYVRSMLGDHETALADYDRSLDLDPTHGLTYIYRGSGWFWKADYESALADYDVVIGAWGRQLSYYSFHNRGAIRLTTGDLDGALADLTTAEAMRPADPFRPRSPKPLALRGLARLMQGDLDGADHDLHDSSHLGFDAVGVIAWALLEARRGHPEEMGALGVQLALDGVDGLELFRSLTSSPLAALPRLQPLMA